MYVVRIVQIRPDGSHAILLHNKSKYSRIPTVERFRVVLASQM